MWPQAVDLYTIYVEHAVLLSAFTVLAAVNAVAHRGERGTRWFPLFTLAALLGAVLVALRGSLPEPLSTLGSCALVSVAYFFLHRSLTEFYGRGRALCRAQLAVIALSLLALLRWGWLAPDATLRLAAYSIGLALQLALSAAFLSRELARPSRSIPWPAGTMAGILAMLSGNYLLRCALSLRFGAPADPLHSGSRLIVLTLLTSVLQGAAIIAFVWTTAARLHDELRLEASTDPLTRLLNRRALAAWAEGEIVRSRQNGWPLSAILLDLDDFKAVNDSWGHLRGDAVLRGVANLLATSLRPGDQIGRLGGDEFVVLLPRTPEEVALAVSERLRDRLESLETGCAGLAVHASFGVAELGGLGLSWEQLIQRCDTALYAAKSLGGNRALVH